MIGMLPGSLNMHKKEAESMGSQPLLFFVPITGTL